MQLITILAAAREGQAQQPPAGRGGRARRTRRGFQNQPMRVHQRRRCSGALKLLGLEFQDAEIDCMLRGVNQALNNYESLRKADVPLDTEPAFHFQPGLPDRKPLKGPQRFETTIAEDRQSPGEPGGPGVRAGSGPGAAGEIARRLLHRPHEDVPGADEEVLAATAVPDHAHRGHWRSNRRRRPTPKSAPGNIADRCTASRSASRICSTPRAFSPRTARSRTRRACRKPMPRWWNGCAMRARC